MKPAIRFEAPIGIQKDEMLKAVKLLSVLDIDVEIEWWYSSPGYRDSANQSPSSVDIEYEFVTDVPYRASAFGTRLGVFRVTGVLKEKRR